MARRSAHSGITTRANTRLTREGIVTAAVALADRDGLDGFSMRKLAQTLDVDAMSIYYHVHDKDTLLAAMADTVAAQITADPGPPPGAAWTAGLRTLIMDARQTMVRHPWAARVIEGRDTPTPAVLAHIERVLAIMRGGGCPIELCHHAIHLLGSRILGFSQDLFEDRPDAAPPPPEFFAALPHVAELAVAATHTGELGGCDDDVEFTFALDLILDGLERHRSAGPPVG
jgi:AcrR family transcriptional regulator